MAAPTLTPTPPPAPTWRSPLRAVFALVRNLWRSLTSMRTALVLLFMLALAAVPGALLPQRSLNELKTVNYIQSHGLLGRLMDKVQLFDVFKSFWFTAIYVLLFISLVGCLTPRLKAHFVALRTPPVPTPRNLARLPRRTVRASDASPDEVADTILANLKGWRKIARRTGPADGSTTVEISAERGYFREVGNLVFHFALLALLVAIAVGKLYGYEGSRIVIAGDGAGFCNTTPSYDSFRAGALVNGTGLAPFCVKVDTFKASYFATGEPNEFNANVSYLSSKNLASGDWQKYRLVVNKPLRMEGDRIYLLGHGYAPTFTVTFPNGESRTQTVQFRPDDQINFLSSGALRFDTPAGLYPNEDTRRQHQIGIEGLFAPTKQLTNGLLTSSFPALNDPAVAVDIYEGDTGLDTGRPQNLYSLSADQINSGRLTKVERVNLNKGESKLLPDGTKVTFDGASQYAAIQVSHDPAQDWVLVSAIFMLGGLVVSLTIKRRRIFARITNSGTSTSADDGVGRTVIEMAGLARTDQAGWGEDFERIADRLLSTKGNNDAGQ